MLMLLMIISGVRIFVEKSKHTMATNEFCRYTLAAWAHCMAPAAYFRHSHWESLSLSVTLTINDVCGIVCSSHIRLQINFVSRWKFIWILKYVRHAHICSRFRRTIHSSSAIWLKVLQRSTELVVLFSLNHIIVVPRSARVYDGFALMSNILNCS